MQQSKHQFYHKGVDNQKRADITVDLKRPPVKIISEWDGAQKDQALEFINRCQVVFDAFKNEIIKSLS